MAHKCPRCLGSKKCRVFIPGEGYQLTRCLGCDGIGSVNGVDLVRVKSVMRTHNIKGHYVRQN